MTFLYEVIKTELVIQRMNVESVDDSFKGVIRLSQQLEHLFLSELQAVLPTLVWSLRVKSNDEDLALVPTDLNQELPVIHLQYLMIE